MKYLFIMVVIFIPLLYGCSEEHNQPSVSVKEVLPESRLNSFTVVSMVKIIDDTVEYLPNWYVTEWYGSRYYGDGEYWWIVGKQHLKRDTEWGPKTIWSENTDHWIVCDKTGEIRYITSIYVKILDYEDIHYAWNNFSEVVLQGQ